MRLFLFLVLLVTSAQTSAAAETSIIGRATVIDGDTIEIKGERVRLHGIDAPESAQLCRNDQGKSYRCGAAAARILEEFLAASQPTQCRFVERDRYGRFVGNCYRADGASVAELLVLSGWAFDWPRYSKGEYADEQAHARAMRLGLWAGTFVYPWEWRAERRASRVSTQPSPAN
jgi:endonuclease YncB( thermonuclease family)